MSPGPLHPVGFWAQLTSGGMLVLSANSDDDVDLGNLVNAGWNFTADGELVGISEGAVAGEYWSDEPDTGIGNSYEVRCASMNGGSTWTQQAATVGTWITISATRVWNCRRTAMAAPGIKSASGNFEIGDVGTSSADVSATLTAYAEN